MTVLVLASNLGGGIRRHLDLVGSVVPLDVHELPETLSLPAKVRAARRVLTERRPDLVVTHGVAASVAVRHRGRRLRETRHLEVWHGDPFFLTPRRRVVYSVMARAGSAPTVQVLTHEWLRRRYADPRSAVEVLPNTVPLAEGRGPRVEPDPARPSRTAVYLGRLSEEKGVADLVAAWPADSADRGWQLDVYGDGPLSDAVAASGHHLRGETSDALGVLSAADVVVLPSWTESSPYTACEALSVGRPLVATRAGDLPELLGSGCGWAVPPRDRDGLRAALLEAQVAPPDELERRGDLGRSWLAEHRPFAAWAAAVRRLYS